MHGIEPVTTWLVCPGFVLSDKAANSLVNPCYLVECIDVHAQQNKLLCNCLQLKFHILMVKYKAIMSGGQFKALQFSEV